MNTPEEIMSETIRQAWERVHELEQEIKKLKAENQMLKEMMEIKA